MVVKVKEIWRVVSFMFSIEFVRMGVLWTLSLVTSHLKLLAQCLCPPKSYPRLPLQANYALKRPICLITGATSGLGAAAAHALAKEGFFVVLVGRSGHLLKKTMYEIKKFNEHAQLEAFEVDLSCFSSIMKFKDCFQQWLLDMDMHSSIQFLINNAGILATSYRETADGFEEGLGMPMPKEGPLPPTTAPTRIRTLEGRSSLCHGGTAPSR